MKDDDENTTIGFGNARDCMRIKAEERIVFFDLETLGLNPRKHPIAEIGAVAVSADTCEVLETFHMRVQFDPREANPRSFSLRKHDPEVWAMSAMDPVLVAEYFSHFLRRHATITVPSKSGGTHQIARLAGHNAESFDGPFIRQWYKKQRKYLPASPALLDTKQRAMWLFEEHPHLRRPANFKLGTLAKYFGTTIPDHTALQDAIATAQVFWAMKQQMMAVTEGQQLYLDVLAEETGLSEEKLFNRAINSLVRDLAA